MNTSPAIRTRRSSPVWSILFLTLLLCVLAIIVLYGIPMMIGLYILASSLGVTF